MDYTTGNVYFIEDAFFELVADPYLMINYDTTMRPHYYAVRDPKTALLWMIPLSSRVKKYETLIADRKKRKKQTMGARIIKLQGKKSVLLFQNMFPVCEKFIAEQYYKWGVPVSLADPKQIKAIEQQTLHVIEMFRSGVKFLSTQPDALRIEKIMLEECRK